MNDIDIIRLTSGLLQFGVAWYALRLGRLFKHALLGWLLFGALSLLALLSLFLAVKPLGNGTSWGISVDIVYASTSLLLLVGMICYHFSLQKFLQEERAEQQALDKWELHVKAQYAELTKTNERLNLRIGHLEREIAERKHAQEQAENDLQALLTSTRHKEQAWLQTGPRVHTTATEAKPTLIPEPEAKPAERPQTTLCQNGEESWTVVAGPATEIGRLKPAAIPAEKRGERPPTAPQGNGEGAQPAIARAATEIVKPKPAPEPAEKRAERPATVSQGNGEAAQPAVAGAATEIVRPKPATEPAEKRDERPPTVPAGTAQVSRPAVTGASTEIGRLKLVTEPTEKRDARTPSVPPGTGAGSPPATAGSDTKTVRLKLVPEPAEKRDERPSAVPMGNVAGPQPAAAASDTKIVLSKLLTEPAEKRDERPPTGPAVTAEVLRPVVAETGTEIIRPKPALESAGINGASPTTAPRECRDEPWQAIFGPDHKIGGRRPIPMRGNKPVGPRPATRHQIQESRRLRFRNLKFAPVK